MFDYVNDAWNAFTSGYDWWNTSGPGAGQPAPGSPYSPPPNTGTQVVSIPITPVIIIAAAAVVVLLISKK